MKPTIKQIETQMAQALHKETGANVEVTMRGDNAWTISGQDEEARKAAAWLQQAGLMTLNEAIYDEEIEETFCYMTSR